MILEELHHAQTVDFLVLVQGNELKFFRVFGYISEGTFYGVEVVGPDGGVLPGSAEGVMQFFLGSDESFVGFIVKGDISEDSSCDEGTNLFDLSGR